MFRVPGHCAAQDLKAALISHARNFADCKRWDVLLEYLSFAFAQVDDLPKWDSDTHNKVGCAAIAGVGCLFLISAGTHVRSMWGLQ